MTRQEARELLQSLAPILTPTGYRVAAMLCLHTNGIDECWVLVPTLAAETGTSERSVQRALRFLESQGIVITQQRQNQSSVYTILPLGGGDRALSPGGDTQVSPISEKPPTLLGPKDHSAATSSRPPAPAPARAREGAQLVVAAYTDALRANGKIPSTSARSRVGREAKRLLDDGFTVEAMIAPAQYIARYGYSPSLLPIITQDGIRQPGGMRKNQIDDAMRRAQEWRP